MAERIACGLGNIDAKIAIFLCHPFARLGAANNEAQNYRSS
jgi:hypothetical protein